MTVFGKPQKARAREIRPDCHISGLFLARFRFFMFPLFFVCFCANMSFAATSMLDDALRATYTACVGIDEELADLKKMAGINTAITGVGTVASVGATATGFAKAKTDSDIEELEKLIKEIEEIQAKDINQDDFDKDTFLKEFDMVYEDTVKNIDKYKNELEELNKKSKSLGNWRTGLLAGSTVTNIAGAVISSRTINKDDIQGQIDECVAAQKELKKAIAQANIKGEDVTEAKRIYDACREYESVDVSKIIKRGKGATIASSAGAAFGGVGTAISAAANSKKIREDNSDAGKSKEKNLNSASNALSVGATAASTAATVFNAMQISAIKKVAAVASECSGVLK